LPGPDNTQNSLDLAALRARLEGPAGRRFWRGLGELAGTPEFTASAHHEFPNDPEKESSGVNRRDVLKLMAASAALAGLSSCTKLPTQKIVPYVRAPEEIIPGKPLFYATAMTLGGVATGLLVESNMGRPTKVEGNPLHPASQGATDLFAQASVLTLYDPDRSQVLTHEGRISSWTAFVEALGRLREEQRVMRGAGLRILTGTVTSPSLAAQLRTLLAEFPAAKWHQYEPCARDAAREGARLAFGQAVNTVYRVDRAEAILSLDSDFLCCGPGALRYVREFSARRDPGATSGSMNRLYAVESTPTITGAMADHRMPLRPGDVERFAIGIAESLGLAGLPEHRSLGQLPGSSWFEAVSKDLKNHRGASLIIPGEHQPPAIHALVHAMNQALGNAGKTLFYTEALEAQPVDHMASLSELAAEMKSGKVDTLVILGANPVYDAPADFEFAKNLLGVKLRIRLGEYDDETSQLCHWHIPEAHYLESWGDGRAYDGTLSLIQPLIAPLYDGKSAHEVLAALGGHAERTGYDLVKDYWKTQHFHEPKRAQEPKKPAKNSVKNAVKDSRHAPGAASEKDFETFWETSLHDGVIAGTALPEKPLSVRGGFGASWPQLSPTSAADALQIIFRPDPAIGDGRFANNGWLQEVPKPLTQLTWDNAALLSPATAARLGVVNEDVVELQLDGHTARAPVWILPGHADSSVTLHLGYGRRRAGRVGTGIGANAYTLRTSSKPWCADGLAIRKTGERYALASTQMHHVIERDGKKLDEPSEAAFERELVRIAPLEGFRKNPQFAKDPEERAAKALSLYPTMPQSPDYAWGMVIDLNKCNGCSACVVACQAENNIPVVGKHEVGMGRAMHWLRVDTYFRGALENPETVHEPILCMHCENAPCELVCPVAATTHSPEGLNEMVYNRCVGTRYCSNNCPYKVRRFNFKLYADWTTPSVMGQRNPNVSVRSRGVMEKCTYCVQRINAAKITAELEDRQVRDGDIVTACQAACPAEAIVFGNIKDPASRVTKLKAQSRNYGLLTELNTRPRTSYLAKLTNPNPELSAPGAGSHERKD
jgi:molybdopterin-containing oxidoreductase family iron-sulfur binding subunit